MSVHLIVDRNNMKLVHKRYLQRTHNLGYVLKNQFLYLTKHVCFVLICVSTLRCGAEVGSLTTELYCASQ